MLQASNIKRISGRLKSFLLAGAFLMVQLIAPLSMSGFASADNPNPPGNNGTLKVHEKGTPSGTESNDPKVCAFNFEGFGFDVGQDGYIQIDGQGQTTGSYGDYVFGPTVADAQHTSYAETQYFNDGGVTIPDGHYKATLYGKDTGQNIDLKDVKAKSKVFKIECEEPEPEGSITIEKNAIPDSQQAFKFVTVGLSTDQTGFTLADTSAPGLPSKTFEKLPAGTYGVKELETTGWRLSDITCTQGADVDQSMEHASVKIHLSEGEHVRCTFENRKKEVKEKPTLSLVKKVEGGNAKPTDWKLWAIPSNDKFPTLSGYGGFDPQQVVPYVTYKLVETGQAEGYTASNWYCDGGEQEGNYIKLAFNQNVTCTITNTRDTGTVTVNKVLKPANDRGLFDLKINGETYAEGVGNGGTTGAQTVDTGEYVVSEAAATKHTKLDHYKSWYKCYDGEKMILQGRGTESTTFMVKAGHDVVCTFVNERKEQHKPATITVVKNVDLNGDGKVDVRDSSKWTWYYQPEKHEQSENFKTGSWNNVTVKPGKYEVTENQREGFHVTRSACYVKGSHEDGNHEEEASQTLVRHDDKASTTERVWLKPGDHAVCYFTNTRDTAKVKVVKRIAPSDDAGLFDLWVNGRVVKYAASDGDSSYWKTVPTGKVHVAESANRHSETALSDYRTSYVCYEGGRGIFDGDHNRPPRPEDGNEEHVLGLLTTAKQYNDQEQNEHHVKIVAKGYGTWVKGLHVSNDNRVTCVFTNVRKPSITIVKDAQPDSSQAFGFRTNASHHDKYFTLVDDGTGEGNSKTFDHIRAGKYYTFEEKDMSELNWMLDSIACEGSDSWKVTEDNKLVVRPKLGEQVVCTFVNVKKAEVTIVKDATTNSPSAFNFSTNLTGETSLFALVDNGTDPELASKSFVVQPGTYTVQEKTLAGWNLSKINCSEGATVEWNGTALELTVAAGDDITCTFVNDPVGGSGGQVLGASTTVDEGPTLVNTGSSAIINLIAGLMFIIMAIGARWFGRKSLAT